MRGVTAPAPAGMQQFDPPATKLICGRARLDQQSRFGPGRLLQRRRGADQQSQHTTLLDRQLPAPKGGRIERVRPSQHRRHAGAAQGLIGRPARHVPRRGPHPNHPPQRGSQSRRRGRIKRPSRIDDDQPSLVSTCRAGHGQGQGRGPGPRIRGDPFHQRTRRKTSGRQQGVQLRTTARHSLPGTPCFGVFPTAELLGQLSHPVAAIARSGCHDSLLAL
jgi:hypothetical protein